MPDGDDRRSDLQNELDPGAERNEIVHRAGHDNDDAAEQYTLHRLVDARERQHSGEKAGKQRQPAEPGDRMIVDAPGLAGMSIAPILQANFRTAGVASRHTAAAASSASSTRTRSRRARAGSIPFRLSFFRVPPRSAAVPEIY